MWKEFKEFAMQGNVIDLAIGVVIGGAFGKIVTSLVSDIIMPLVGALTGGLSFSDLRYVITPAVYEGGVEVTPANTLNYGLFIDNVINFLIIAVSIFIVIRAINQARKRLERQPQEEVAEEAAALTTDEILIQIRDLMEEQGGKKTVTAMPVDGTKTE